MIPYGDTHPMLPDNRLPLVLVILDGLGDRAVPELGGRTPAEAAETPHLDRLAARGASALHLPFGPGKAPASEISHWALFGCEPDTFPGRAVLEARGHGTVVQAGQVHSYAALRVGEERDGVVWVTGRAAPSDGADAHVLFEALDGITIDGFRFGLQRLTRGEALLSISGQASPDITDSDPFFEQIHPWLRPLPLADATNPATATATSSAVEEFLRSSRRLLHAHPVNVQRRERGLPVLDVLTTKWTGMVRPVPSFEERVGVPGAAVTSSALYRGLAATLGLISHDIEPLPDPGEDLFVRFETAATLLDEGAQFVHVHTKAADEAGHTKDPREKMRVLQLLDEASRRLDQEPFLSAVVVITGDHATPSVDGILHSGDPTPFLMTSPTTRPDAVTRFGESFAERGAMGTIGACDVLPLMLDRANRPMFLGSRITPYESLGLPDCPEPMT